MMRLNKKKKNYMLIVFTDNRKNIYCFNLKDTLLILKKKT